MRPEDSFYYLLKTILKSKLVWSDQKKIINLKWWPASSVFSSFFLLPFVPPSILSFILSTFFLSFFITFLRQKVGKNCHSSSARANWKRGSLRSQSNHPSIHHILVNLAQINHNCNEQELQESLSDSGQSGDSKAETPAIKQHKWGERKGEGGEGEGGRKDPRMWGQRIQRIFTSN